LESNFNNNAPPDPSDPIATDSVTPESGTPEQPTTETPVSAAVARFRSCRWMQPAEEGHAAEFCTHREVKPYAGATTFDAEAWCPECTYFKLRRVPKKRSPENYSY